MNVDGSELATKVLRGGKKITQALDTEDINVKAKELLTAALAEPKEVL